MTVDADISPSEDLFGKTVTDLQENVVIGSSAITGTSKYVTGYTGFSSKPEEQEGNYLVIHCAATDADSITVELVGGTKGPVTLDADGLIVELIRNTSQKIKVVATKGNLKEEKVFSLSGLVLEPAG